MKNTKVVILDFFSKGQFIGVIGHVGSGKSSLLSAITADMDRSRGKVSFISYFILYFLSSFIRLSLVYSLFFSIIGLCGYSKGWFRTRESGTVDPTRHCEREHTFWKSF